MLSLLDEENWSVEFVPETEAAFNIHKQFNSFDIQ